MATLMVPVRALRRQPTPERGTTLIEMLVVLAITGVVYAALAGTMVRLYLSDSTMASLRGLRQVGRLATTRMAGELRNSGRGLKTVTETFSTATAAQLTFAADIDQGSPAPPCTNESNDDGVEQITYRFQGTLLERRVECWVGGAWQAEVPFTPLATGLQSGSFRYFDIGGLELMTGGGGLAAADRARVARVRMALDLEDGDAAIEGETTPHYQVSIDVLVRNNDGFLDKLSGRVGR